jgi:RND superfamily putative drug exporter
MRELMVRLSRFLGRHRRPVLIAWALVIVLAGFPSIKELGLGCAVAIALDATLVRLILARAAMKLLGGWNWWMPSWLDRVLPELSFEGGHRKPEPAEA